MKIPDKQDHSDDREQEPSFASQVVKTVVRSAAGKVAATLVTAALGPIAGAITKMVVSGNDDLLI